MTSETEQREAENDQLALDEAELEWRGAQMEDARVSFAESKWITLRIAFLKKRIDKIQKAQREAAQFKSWEERVSAGQNSRR